MIYIYVKRSCPFSMYAIQRLKQTGTDYHAIWMDDPMEWEKMKKVLSDYAGVPIRTVPQAFFQYQNPWDYDYIGDSEALDEYLS